MVRNMTLAGVLALLPVAACSSDIDDQDLEAKAQAAEEKVVALQDSAEPDPALKETVAEMEAADPLYGPVIGEALAVSSLLNSEGVPVELSGLVAEGGGVVVFSRSAGWCPFCQKQMVELKDAVQPLADMGMKLTVITYDTPEILSAFADQNEISYALVSDANSSTIIANGLLNEGAEEGSRFYGIPHPSVIVLASDGEVRNVHVDENYRVRPSNDDVLALAADVSGG